MSYIPNRAGFHLGFCFGTILMRSATEDVYYNSISYSVSKNHFYLVSIGDQIEEEKFWIKGRELFTLYTNTQGFQVLSNSQLEKDMEDKLSEEDYSNFHHIFGYGSNYGNHFRDITKGYPFSQVKILPKLYPLLDDCINTIKSFGKEITVYSIQTKSKPYYLEEIKHYGISTSCI